MRTQTKPFRISLIKHLIDRGDLINNHLSDADGSNVVDRVKNKIELPLLYAVEGLDGDLKILPNNVIGTLLNYDTRNVLQMYINICILDNTKGDEATRSAESELFEKIVGVVIA